jgi:hypothetical protein
MREVEPQRPQFCPWCGSPVGFARHEHTSRYETLREQALARGDDPGQLPERIRDLLATDAFVGACAGCRTISHVIGHRAQA